MCRNIVFSYIKKKLLAVLLLEPPLDFNILLGLYWWLNREIVYIINLQSILQLIGVFLCRIFNWNLSSYMYFQLEFIYFWINMWSPLCLISRHWFWYVTEIPPPPSPTKKYSTNLAYCISSYLNIDLISPFFFNHFRKKKKNNNIITQYCMPLKTLKIVRNHSR